MNELELAQIYNAEFYKNNVNGSLSSANLYIKHLLNFKNDIESVIDIGCGSGTWLKACKNNGVKYLYGFDGVWNKQENMIDEDIKFHGCDLSFPIEFAAKTDIAISVEVAEHIPSTSASTFVNSLANASDVIIFGAAFPHQGGENHINEQYASYWANIFAQFSYIPFDIFRPYFWDSQEVEFWYKQNTFLYVNTKSENFTNLIKKNIHPVQNISFMNCIHPSMYDRLFR
jgi:SAM-dependent methyltransferase